MTEKERLQTIAHAATEDYAALDSFQRRKRERYAAGLACNFLRGYERFNRRKYAGEIRILDLRALMTRITWDGTQETFEGAGAVDAYMRGKDRSERHAATFADYVAWASTESQQRKW